MAQRAIMVVSGVLGAALLASTTAIAQPGTALEANAPDGSTIDAQSKMALIATPHWLHVPTGDDLAANYPATAARQGISGIAMMRCTVTAAGLMSACELINEEPQGQGFGAATLRLAQLFKMAPKAVDGRSVEGATIIIPVRWRM